MPVKFEPLANSTKIVWDRGVLTVTPNPLEESDVTKQELICFHLISWKYSMKKADGIKSALSNIKPGMDARKYVIELTRDAVKVHA